MVGLHEVPDDHLLAGLELEQLEQVLGKALYLRAVGQGQQTLRTKAQNLCRNTKQDETKAPKRRLKPPNSSESGVN